MIRQGFDQNLPVGRDARGAADCADGQRIGIGIKHAAGVGGKCDDVVVGRVERDTAAAAQKFQAAGGDSPGAGISDASAAAQDQHIATIGGGVQCAGQAHTAAACLQSQRIVGTPCADGH